VSIWPCFQGLICDVCLCFFYWRHWLEWLMNYWWFVSCKSKGLCDHEIYVWGRVLAWVLAPDDRHGRVTSSMGRATYILETGWASLPIDAEQWPSEPILLLYLRTCHAFNAWGSPASHTFPVIDYAWCLRLSWGRRGRRRWRHQQSKPS